jgi:hypothetical protein
MCRIGEPQSANTTKELRMRDLPPYAQAIWLAAETGDIEDFMSLVGHGHDIWFPKKVIFFQLLSDFTEWNDPIASGM